MDSSVARTSPARGSRVRCRAVSAVRAGSAAVQSRRWRSWRCSAANTSPATRSAIPGPGIRAATGEVSGGGGGTGTGGQHQRGAPTVRLGDDRVPDVGGAGPGVRLDEADGLVVAEPEHVAAQDRQVTQQLEHQPREGQVPPGEQHDPEGVGVVVEPLVDVPQRGGGQQVGLVDDDEAGCRPRVAAGPVEHRRQLRGSGRPGGVQPRRVVLTRELLQPARDTERLSGACGRHDHGDRVSAGLVEAAPQHAPGEVPPGEPGSPGDGCPSTPVAGPAVLSRGGDLLRDLVCRHVPSSRDDARPGAGPRRSLSSTDTGGISNLGGLGFRGLTPRG